MQEEAGQRAAARELELGREAQCERQQRATIRDQPPCGARQCADGDAANLAPRRGRRRGRPAACGERDPQEAPRRTQRAARLRILHRAVGRAVGRGGSIGRSIAGALLGRAREGGLGLRADDDAALPHISPLYLPHISPMPPLYLGLRADDDAVLEAAPREQPQARRAPRPAGRLDHARHHHARAVRN